jgi:hypothetical protein
MLIIPSPKMKRWNATEIKKETGVDNSVLANRKKGLE